MVPFTVRCRDCGCERKRRRSRDPAPEFYLCEVCVSSSDLPLQIGGHVVDDDTRMIMVGREHVSGQVFLGYSIVPVGDELREVMRELRRLAARRVERSPRLVKRAR